MGDGDNGGGGGSSAGGFSNAFVEQLASNLLELYDFCGVYSSDKIPKELIFKKRFSIIVNQSPSDVPKGHFICIIRLQEVTVMYLDPLGLPPLASGIITFLLSFPPSCSITYSTKKVQPNESELCALYVLQYCAMYDGRRFRGPFRRLKHLGGIMDDDTTEAGKENEARVIDNFASMIQ